MASISTGSGHAAGKRAVDHEVPLIPFIDLLLCCVMFLLVTAVWNRLAEMQANLQMPGQGTVPDDPSERPSIVVRVGHASVVIGSDAGDRTEIANLAEGEPDLSAVIAQLAPRHASGVDLVVLADDGVRYESVIATMDAVVHAGFEQVTMGAGL